MAALAGYPDALDAGHALAIAEIVHQGIDTSFEGGDVSKGCDSAVKGN
jgi:hypothetical protein